MKAFGGPVLFLDRSDINTDEIIPAKYLTEVEKERLKAHLLEDLKLAGFDPAGDALQQAKVIVTRSNFGCGSSREHAPWALEVNEIHLVVAESFARIFRQNMFNCGMMAVEVAAEDLERIFAIAQNEVSCNVEGKTLRFTAKDGREEVVDFSLAPFDQALVEAGGWVEFADARY